MSYGGEGGKDNEVWLIKKGYPATLKTALKS